MHDGADFWALTAAGGAGQENPGADSGAGEAQTRRWARDQADEAGNQSSKSSIEILYSVYIVGHWLFANWCQERDADSDQKNILADLKEELALLKEENKQLNHDSMSGKSLQEKAQAQDIEVRRLRFLFYYLFFINIKPWLDERQVPPGDGASARHWGPPPPFFPLSYYQITINMLLNKVASAGHRGPPPPFFILFSLLLT